MSTSLNITAFSGKNSPEFQKHFKAVKFCVEHGLSFPAETSEFFKGRVGLEENLEDFQPEYLVENIENGIRVPLKFSVDAYHQKIINVSEIPKEVDTIVIELS